jgi:hypothetical protein
MSIDKRPTGLDAANKCVMSSSDLDGPDRFRV